MTDQMTFEEFRPYIQQKYAAVFAAAVALPSQVNPILDVPVGEPLHKIVRFMAKIVANDFGGLTILALYGSTFAPSSGDGCSAFTPCCTESS